MQIGLARRLPDDLPVRCPVVLKDHKNRPEPEKINEEIWIIEEEMKRKPAWSN